jgi:hypothetical protein
MRGAKAQSTLAINSRWQKFFWDCSHGEVIMGNVKHTDQVGHYGVGIQSMARRQLTASLIVAFVIAAASGLMALRPAPHVVAPSKSVVILQLPVVAPRVAWVQYGVETP